MEISKYKMQAIAYFLLSKFEDWTYKNWNIPNILNSIGYQEYNNFWKCEIPVEWYEDILILLDLDYSYLSVEVNKVKGNHSKNLHYHKLSHGLCIILGPKCGFEKVAYNSAIQLDASVEIAYEDKEYYIPVECKHTFYGDTYNKGNKGDLYYLSIYNKFLLDKEEDIYYV